MLGNLIGTAADGITALPNQDYGIGVQIGSGNVIGSSASPNVIAFNAGAGVVVGAGTANAISGNAIFSNGGLGIDLGTAGVTPNDAGDADTGANNLQNFPVLAAASGGVHGTLNSAPNGAFRIQFFGNTACDASDNGEGATFLGATSVATDANGTATIPYFPAAVGQFVTATATDSSNNTSEFSACVIVTGIAQHFGTADPTSEGFARFSGVTTVAPVANDGGAQVKRPQPVVAPPVTAAA